MTTQNNVTTGAQQEEEFDVLKFLLFLQKRLKLLLLGLILGALAGWALSSFVIHPKYASFVDLYITNSKKTMMKQKVLKKRMTLAEYQRLSGGEVPGR